LTGRNLEDGKFPYFSQRRREFKSKQKEVAQFSDKHCKYLIEITVAENANFASLRFPKTKENFWP